MTSVPLAEELLLLAYDDDTGKARGSRIGLDLGMAAAVLVELALAGRIGMEGNTIVARDATAIGEPIADAVLARVAGEPPQPATSWVQRLRHRLRDRVLEDLCERGVMRDVDETTMEHIHVHRYPTVDTSVERDVRARLVAALRGGAPDERTAALATILAAVRMEPTLGIADEEIQVTHRKLEEIAERAGFAGSGNLDGSTVRPSVALVVAALARAIETALGRAPA